MELAKEPIIRAALDICENIIVRRKNPNNPNSITLIGIDPALLNKHYITSAFQLLFPNSLYPNESTTSTILPLKEEDVRVLLNVIAPLLDLVDCLKGRGGIPSEKILSGLAHSFGAQALFTSWVLDNIQIKEIKRAATRLFHAHKVLVEDNSQWQTRNAGRVTPGVSLGR